MNKSQEYLAGFDCGLNGPNQLNSYFGHFSSLEKTTEWENGKKAGELEKDIKLTIQAWAIIKSSKKEFGSIECPKCKQNIFYTTAKGNGHIRMKCETIGCIQGME